MCETVAEATLLLANISFAVIQFISIFRLRRIPEVEMCCTGAELASCASASSSSLTKSVVFPVHWFVVLHVDGQQQSQCSDDNNIPRTDWPLAEVMQTMHLPIEVEHCCSPDASFTSTDTLPMMILQLQPYLHCLDCDVSHMITNSI